MKKYIIKFKGKEITINFVGEIFEELLKEYNIPYEVVDKNIMNKIDKIKITNRIQKKKIKWYKRLVYRIKTGKKSPKYKYYENGKEVHYRVSLKGDKWLDER